MSGIDIIQLRDFIVRPILQELEMWSLSAERLVIGTCLIESDGGRYLKQVNGVAIGIYQMEPATHDSLWNDFLRYHPLLIKRFPDSYNKQYKISALIMLYDLVYATLMCRIKYYSIKDALPKENDIIGLSLYYKKFYNTEHGKADPNKFAELLASYMETEEKNDKKNEKIS